MDPKMYFLKWNKFNEVLPANLSKQLMKGQFTDCYLSAEGKSTPCHRVILSAMSPYFERVLLLHFDKTPVITLLDKNITFQDVKDIIKFIYDGECIVLSERLENFLDVCEKLEIKGLQTNEAEDQPLKMPEIEDQPMPEVIEDQPMQEVIGESFVNAVLQPEIDEFHQNEQEIINSSDEDPLEEESPKHRKKSLLKPKIVLTRLPASQRLDIKKQGLKRRQTISEDRLNPLNAFQVKPAKSLKFNIDENVEKPDKSKDSKTSVNGKAQESQRKPTTVHSAQQFFVCKFCDKQYSIKGSHYRHERECKDNPNPATKQCSICMETVLASRITTHQKKHLNKRRTVNF